MSERPINYHDPVQQLISGHFDERKGYAVWRPRGTGDWLLIYTLAGLGRFEYAGGELIAEPFDMVLLRPGTLHAYGVEATLQHWELLWAHFQPRPHWHPWLDWPEIAPGLLRLRLHDPAIQKKAAHRFHEANDLCNGALRHREDFAVNALEEVLLWCDMQHPSNWQSRMDGRVRDAMDYMCRQLREKMAIDDLAGRFGLSASRFAHLFREQAGVTPQQFLERQRLGRAKQLLDATSRTVKEIAHAVGFENPFYFTLRFKRYSGMSPKEYRRRTVEASNKFCG